MTETTLTLDTVAVVTDHQLSSTLAGEEVILDLDSGTYFGLNAVGADVWRRLDTPQRLSDVCDALAAQYDVDRATLDRDVLDLVAELHDNGLVELRDAVAG